MAKWCLACERTVSPQKKFNMLGFIFLAGIFYLPYYFLKSKKCPICNGTNFANSKPILPKD